MTYRVDLAVRAEDALAELLEQERQEVMETIAAALVRRDVWPPLGGWEGAVLHRRRWWVAFTAYADGIEVYALGRERVTQPLGRRTSRWRCEAPVQRHDGASLETAPKERNGLEAHTD
ncbi:hypothetical protein ABT288_12680 [Streptomyces sp. NPDC001093]|uniref:hypothetical protein n=1 Tax=Streptomyces sp. NPDC001093 TaxID=3154376 RepID=UPI00331EF7A9